MKGSPSLSLESITDKPDEIPLTLCAAGTVDKPQPAVVLVLDRKVTEDDITEFRSYLQDELHISSYEERCVKDEQVFVCLYLTHDMCEEMAERLSYHVQFCTYTSKNPPDSWTTKLYSVLTYGTLSYNHFTEIEYSVMYHKRLRSKLEQQHLNRLYSVRVQSEMIYQILQNMQVCGKIKIEGHFVPHTPEAQEIYKKMSWFPPLFPLKEFRDYFGEELAFTYAWSNFWWIYGLVPISIFALFSLILGLALHDYTDSETSWGLFSRIMVNGSTNYYIGFVMIWIAVFQYRWSNAAPIFSLQWGVSNFYMEEPAYKSPNQDRYRALLALPNLVISVLGFIVAAACTAVLFILVLIILRIELNRLQLDEMYVDIICQVTYAILNTVAGSYFIPWFSRFLTDLEDHKFQSFYTNSVIFKYTGYYLMSSYIYLLFLSLDIHSFVFDNWDFKPGQHMENPKQFEVVELSRQLLFQIVALRLKGMAKIFLFFCLSKFQRRANRKMRPGKEDLLYIVENYKSVKLLDTSEVSMWMSDRIIMYGYLTMFSYHVPIVAFIALIIELLVCKYECYMLLCESQRPQPRRVGNIKQWQGIIYLVNIMSIIINSYSIHLRATEADESEQDCWVNRDNKTLVGDDDGKCVFDREVLPLLFMPVFMLMTSLIQIQDTVSGDKYQFHVRNQYKQGTKLFAEDLINTDCGESHVRC